MTLFLLLLPIALAFVVGSVAYFWGTAENPVQIRIKLPAVQLPELRRPVPVFAPTVLDGCPQRPCHARLRSRLSPAIR